ncbi:MAG TPA: choice-of-anchor D domain-containing protein, partial [Rubrobacteraceae bacterium]|nr:choice-of-anchor D domain-containing protein [Rubrobacteraceae bacterium]
MRLNRTIVLLAAIAVTLMAYMSFGAKTADAQTVTLDPTTVDFGAVVLDTTSTPQTVTITNTTAGPLTITGATLSGPNAGDFTLLNQLPVGGVTINPNGTVTFDVAFSPSALGSRVANLDFTTTTVPVSSAALTGTGVAPTSVNSAPTIAKVSPAPRSKVKDTTPTIKATVRDRG